MSFDVLFVQRIIRMLLMYFSIVLRSAAWASRVSESASLMITTVNVVSSYNLSKGYRLSTFKSMFCIQIHLLSLRYLLQDLLDDDSVVNANITRLWACISVVGKKRRCANLGVISM
jgi:hypothetical protein